MVNIGRSTFNFIHDIPIINMAHAPFIVGSWRAINACDWLDNVGGGIRASGAPQIG